MFVVPVPTWGMVLAALLGMALAYTVLGVAIFHFADYMKRRSQPFASSDLPDDEA